MRAPFTKGTSFAEPITGSNASGATAEVYEATSPSFGRCALKLLSPRYTAQSTMSARFRLEARLLAELHHPSLVEIVDFGSAAGRFYLAMPLLSGTTLRDRPHDPAMTWRDAVAVVVAVLEGLGVAHRAGVVHRDIKPDNIFLCDDGVIKVIDFGIAKVEDRSIVTEPGLVVGTPAYMSPEQVIGQEVDARSDIYSVGVVLYELLAGRRPFPGEDPGLVAAMRVRRDPQSLALAAPKLPSELAAAVDRAMRHSLDLRYQSALDFESALRACLALDVLRAPDSLIPPPVVPVSRVAPTRTAHGNVDATLPPKRGSEAKPEETTSSRVERKSSRPIDPSASTVVSAGAPPETSANERAPLEFIAWEDIFVLVDHGNAKTADYVTLSEQVIASAAKYPAGIGGLVIVPRKATPPSEAARHAMNGMQERLAPKLRGVCWLVEGDGFQGAMVRAVLTGVKLLADFPYPSHVTTSMHEALTWLVRRVDGDDHRLLRVSEGERRIAAEREKTPPSRSRR